ASRNESTVNYEISSITEHKVIPSGGITKISVAAIVGGSFATPGDAASFQPRSKTELKTLQGLIEKAIGFDEDRGDSVEIQSLPLLDITSTQDEEALSAQENKAFYLELARYGLAGLAMLLLAFFILRPLARLIGSDPESKKKEAEEKAANASLQTLSPAAFAHLESMQQARHAIQHQPERAGKIVREWVEQV
ncbi:MAG TPA: flagellar M-ring protein FliF, partial [Zetaproteobacteria bacterium]|nr:flagellar M-ring protein FliF [Zetaproteobacteria bacterium]